MPARRPRGTAAPTQTADAEQAIPTRATTATSKRRRKTKATKAKATKTKATKTTRAKARAAPAPAVGAASGDDGDGTAGEEPGQPGRPRITPSARDLEQIEVMARIGTREDAIAMVLGWSPKTFQRRKQDTPEVLTALNKGVANANIVVGNKLWQAVMAGKGWAIRWFEMTRLGYAPLRHIAGPGGGPIPMEDVSTLAPEQRRARIRELLDKGQQRAQAALIAGAGDGAPDDVDTGEGGAGRADAGDA